MNPGQEVWVQILTLTPLFGTFLTLLHFSMLTDLGPACWLSCWAQKHPVFTVPFAYYLCCLNSLLGFALGALRGTGPHCKQCACLAGGVIEDY